MKEQKQRRNEGGITLIALVVTIVILLILAGVTIGFLSGEDGLISRITKSIDTGKIEDYLKYKQKRDEKLQEGIKNANSNKWLGNNGIKFGGPW